MKENVKIDGAIVEKVRKRIKKTKQTIGGFFELSAAAMITGPTSAEQIQEWKKKAEKWDALAGKIDKFYTNEEGEYDEENPENKGDLTDIGEAAASAFGYL
jgi:hypothetical protein